MIPRIRSTWHTPQWQSEMSNAIASPKELLQALELPLELLPQAERAHSVFPLRVPASYLSRIEKGDLNDPLLRQILPLCDELQSMQGYSSDPVQDHEASPIPGLIHKYHGRALLTLTGACAIHCRYCFRRHFPYQDNNPLGRSRQAIIDYLHDREDIHEVILSGGDPLSLSDQKLTELLADLTQIPHLHYLRIHSRLPVVIPTRVTPELIHTLSNIRLITSIVVHINHANEIDGALEAALRQLQQAGIHLLNQSVLLKGVNDDVDSLAQLSHRLYRAGVMPYYLHTLDRVSGAHHFDLAESRVGEIYRELLARLPGYLVPRLVSEIPGEANKTPWHL